MGTFQCDNTLEQLFDFLNNETKLSLKLRNDPKTHLGKLSGFDEHFNIVFYENESVFLVKGDCISEIKEFLY